MHIEIKCFTCTIGKHVNIYGDFHVHDSNTYYHTFLNSASSSHETISKLPNIEKDNIYVYSDKITKKWNKHSP